MEKTFFSSENTFADKDKDRKRSNISKSRPFEDIKYDTKRGHCDKVSSISASAESAKSAE